MSIAIFKEITTEEVLTALEEEGKKYKGLYVDMNNADERRYVKKQAEKIKTMLKALDRARIDKKKAFNAEVEKEAAQIKQRLEEANSPYTFLIEAHQKEREKILAEEKRIREAKELAEQIESDHEIALLIDGQMILEKAERERVKKEHEEKLKAEAAEKAILDLKAKQALDEKIEKEKEAARLANTEHLKAVNNGILDALVYLGIEEDKAKLIIRAAAKGEIANLKITY